MPVIAPPLYGMAASDEPSELDSSDARSDSGSDSDTGRQPLAMRDAPVVAGPTAQASPPRSSGRTSNDPVQQVPPATAPLPAAPGLPRKMIFHYYCLLVIIPYPHNFGTTREKNVVYMGELRKSIGKLPEKSLRNAHLLRQQH